MRARSIWGEFTYGGTPKRKSQNYLRMYFSSINKMMKRK